MRVKMKVWTDPTSLTKRRFIVPAAFMKHKGSAIMRAYAMCDEETKLIELTQEEWNTLPFFYFKEDGEAPRHTTRVPDELKL